LLSLVGSLPASGTRQACLKNRQVKNPTPSANFPHYPLSHNISIYSIFTMYAVENTALEYRSPGNRTVGSLPDSRMRQVYLPQGRGRPACRLRQQSGRESHPLPLI